MLVLSRKAGQRITLDLGDGRSIVITLIQLRGEAARLGFTAPEEVRIWRNEVLPDPTKTETETEPIPLVSPSWVRDAQDARRTTR